MIKKIIKEHFSNCKRVTNTGATKFLRNNPRIDRVLTRILEKQPLWESKLNLINSVLKNIKLSRCKICNNLMPFTKNTFDFCSKECMYKDHDHYDKNALTKLQRYGSATYNNSDKAKKTSLEKYGVDNPAKAEIVKNKIKKTSLEKYGVEYAFQSEKVKEKICKTKMKKYNVPHHMLYHRWKTIQEWKDFVIPMFDIYELYKDKQHLKWKCVKCGNIFEQNIYSTGFNKKYDRLPRCKKCYPFMHGVSRLEKEISQFVSQYVNIDENNRRIIAPLELDIVIPDKKIAIEVDGSYWHSFNKYTQLYKKDIANCHLNKTELCESKGYRLIHIFEWEWTNKQEIIKEKLKAILGVDRKKIYARKCIVKEIDAKEKNEFLNKYHIQGADQTKVKLGLFHENELVAVMTFGNPRFNKNYDWELIRYATKFEYQVLGGAGKLLSYFRKHYSGSIITYADRRFSQGDLYNKIGFKFLRYSSPNYVWLKDNMVLKRYNTMKLTLEEILGEDNIDYSKSETENMINNGYYQIFDCGNIVYEII